MNRCEMLSTLPGKEEVLNKTMAVILIIIIIIIMGLSIFSLLSAISSTTVTHNILKKT